MRFRVRSGPRPLPRPRHPVATARPQPDRCRIRRREPCVAGSPSRNSPRRAHRDRRERAARNAGHTLRRSAPQSGSNATSSGNCGVSNTAVLGTNDGDSGNLGLAFPGRPCFRACASNRDGEALIHRTYWSLRPMGSQAKPAPPTVSLPGGAGQGHRNGPLARENFLESVERGGLRASSSRRRGD